MAYGETMSSRINTLKALMHQLVESGIKIEKDTKAILLNNLPSSYNNIIFTLSQILSQSLEAMISTLMVEEKQVDEEEVGENSLSNKGNITKKDNKGGRSSNKRNNF